MNKKRNTAAAATNMRDYLVPGTDSDVVAKYESLAEHAKESSLALVENEYVVLDTETTGFDPRRCSLIEIAAVRMRGNDITGRFSTFVDDGVPIPAEITELTGIKTEDLAGAPRPEEAVAQFADFAQGCDLVAHNADFDRSFIMMQASPGSLSSRWIDTLALSHIVLPRFKTHRLTDLSRAFGTHQSSHRALDDVLALAGIWRILLTAIQEMTPGLAGFIAGISPDTDWPLRDLFQQAADATPGLSFSLRANRNERLRSEGGLVKNDAEEVPLHFPTPAEIEAAFEKDGIAGAMYPYYEKRAEQVAMSLEILHGMSESSFCALEAGTGVGKSMAYLLPCALIAKQNAITMGVATKTNALMDQLVYHELPRLQAALGELSYIALKGYDHYPCLRKVERMIRDGQSDELEVPVIEMLASLYSFFTQTSWGDLDALNIYWSRLPRQQIQANAEDCLKTRCPFFPKRCYLHGARRAATSADIVVTNHALLFRDIQMDNGILPPIRHWVVDEAHAVEGEARKQLSHSISARDFENILNRLTNPRTGIVGTIRSHAAELEGGKTLFGVTADIDDRASQLKAISTSFFSYVKELADTQDNTGYDRMTLWVGPNLRDSGAWQHLQGPGHSLKDKTNSLVKRLRDLISMTEQFEGAFAAQEADLSTATCALEEMLMALGLVLDGSDDSYVYSVELDRNPEKCAEALIASKLDIGQVLHSDFYPLEKSVIYTSATLATGDKTKPFSHFERTSGLALLDKDCVLTKQLASSYDFDHNMTVLLPCDMPEPNARDYRRALSKLLTQVHRAMGGSTLTLFTNRREMEALYAELKPILAKDGIELIAQTRGTSAKSLRDRFLADESLSLFALKSFWEGFDAPGDTLRCVVIPKLPFGRPDDPIARERELRESSAAWRRYSLPEAVMDLKQAAGRLIRNANDSGWLVLADARLQTKNYAKSFLRAMPTSDIRTLSTPEIADLMRTGEPGLPKEEQGD